MHMQLNFRRKLSVLSLAIAAAVPMALPGTAAAQYQTNAYNTASTSATVSSLGVDQVQRLTPGTVLAFNLDGTPGSTVTLQIAGATASLQMNEVRPGHYEGEYTVRQRDRLTAASRVTANVVKDGRTASASLARSLVQGARDPAPLPTAQITAFNVEAPDRVRPGDELSFSLNGTPGGKARVTVQGVPTSIALNETSRGVYEGSYVVRRADKLRGPLQADATLVADKREARQRFERQMAQGPNGNMNGNNGNGYGRQQAAVTCADCGAVTAVELVEVKGDAPNVIGTIAGGVLGGVVGNQVGGGRGRDIATVIGAVGGAYAGNRVENNMGKTKVHRVTVRLDAGTTQSFDYANDPAVQVGTRVRVENGALIRL